MPLYEYRCDACGARVEKIQKLSDPPPEACASCGQGPMVKQLSSPAIQFKGSGWYITDYAKKGGAAPEGSAGKPENKADAAPAKSESPKSESAPAAAATPKPSSES